MVASERDVNAAADPVRTAAELAARMQAHAANAEWEQAEDCAVRLRAAVLRVPERERRALLASLRQAVEQARDRAGEARSVVAGRLAELRRGKDMAEAYAAND